MGWAIVPVLLFGVGIVAATIMSGIALDETKGGLK